MRLRQYVAFALISTFVSLQSGLATTALRSLWARQDTNPRPQMTIRVPVRLIAVDVIVTDEQGKSLIDLRKDDFQVFDNGRRQEIRHFRVTRINAPVSQIPLPPPPRMPTFSGQGAMPEMAPRGTMDASSGADICSPNSPAAVAMRASLLAAIEEKMAKTSDMFTRASLTAQTRYQLGYYPEGEILDGQYRHIEVRVNRPGMKVVSREGYFAGDTLPAPEIEEPIVRDRIAAAVAKETDSDELPFKVTAGKTTSGTGQSQIKIDLQIDPAKVGFKTVENKHLGRIRIAIFYADDKGTYLGESWQTMNLQLQEEAYRLIMRSRIPFSALIPAKSPKQMLRRRK